MEINKVPDFGGRVTVIGDVMLDRYWYGSSSRISPEAPVPVVNVERYENRAGGAANVALNLAALGINCDIIGIVGKDEQGGVLKDLLKQKNIEPRFLEEENLPTITKLRILSRHQQLLRVDFEKGYESVDQGHLMQTLRQSLRDTNVVICSDYGKGALSSVQSMIKECRSRNIRVLVDPKGTDFSRYSGAHLLTPNMSEFEAVVGKVKDDEDLERRALKLIKDVGLDALLVTRSEDGMSLIVPGKSALHIPTYAREVFDVTGAGDTVIATLAACLASGCDLPTACAVANYAGGIVVGKLGTSTVTPSELQDEVVSRYGSCMHSGVVTEDELVEQVAHLKQKGKRVVMTNGCFDILHRGHVDYLQKARALGDALIVAVNSDESVQRLKGPTRPIVPLENRMDVLAALGCVDFVVPFTEDTPQRLIARVLPDILVKGGDYKVEQIAGHKEVLENGGKVKVLNFVDNCSTSNIVKKIQSQA